MNTKYDINRISRAVRFRAFQHVTGYTFERLKEYHCQMEKAQKKEKAFEEQQLSDRTDNITDQEYLEVVADDFARINDYFTNDYPNYLRYSFILLVYMITDTELDRICRLFCEMMKPECAINYNGIESTRKCLDKVLGIIPSSASEWNNIIDLQKTRNTIAHANGYVSKSYCEKYLRQLAKREIGLSLSEHDQLVINSAYCDLMLESCEKLFLRIYKDADKMLLK